MKRALRTTDADMLADQAREAFAAAIRDTASTVEEVKVNVDALAQLAVDLNQSVRFFKL